MEGSGHDLMMLLSEHFHGWKVTMGTKPQLWWLVP